MGIAIEIASEATPELLVALRSLLPQLTGHQAGLTSADLARLLATPSTTVVIARDEAGRIVGTATMVMFEIPTGRGATLEDVVVDDQARGQGIGAALTIEVLRLAKERGAVHVDLTTAPHRQAAHRLYERLGFQRRVTDVYRHDLGR